MALDNKFILADEKLQPYLKTLIDNNHLYHRGNLVDDETFIDITHKWIDFFEKNIKQTVENTFSFYELLKVPSGYSAISERWGFSQNRFTKEFIKENYEKYFVACIAHLYQGYDTEIKNDRTYRSGATGLNIYCSFTVSKIDSEFKRVKHIIVSTITMGINIPVSEHVETDVNE